MVGRRSPRSSFPNALTWRLDPITSSAGDAAAPISTSFATAPLDLLRAGHTDYVINDAALDYMGDHVLAGTFVQRLANHEQRRVCR